MNNGHYTVEFKQEKSKGILTINIQSDALKNKYNEIVQKNRSKIQVKGFRVGHVPNAIIDKIYGQRFKIDALNDIVSEAYQNHVEENSLKVISRPHLDIDDKEMKLDNGITATLTFDLPPFVKLGAIESVSIKPVELIVTDNDINNEIENYRKQHSFLEIKEGEAVKDDYVGFSLKACDESDNEVKTFDDRLIKIGEDRLNFDIDEEFIGLKKDDKKTFSKKYSDTVTVAEFKNKNIHFTVVVNEVKYMKLPEVTDDFIKSLGKHESVEAFKVEIRKQLEEYGKNYQRKYNLNEVYEKLIAISDIDIPKTLVDAQSEQTIHSYAKNFYGMSREGFDKILNSSNSSTEQFKKAIEHSVLKDLKIEAINEQIATQQNFPVTDDDYSAFYADESIRTGKTIEEIKKEVTDKNLFKNLDFFIRIKKAEDFILNSVKKEKAIKYNLKEAEALDKKKAEKEDKIQDKKNG